MVEKKRNIKIPARIFQLIIKSIDTIPSTVGVITENGHKSSKNFFFYFCNSNKNIIYKSIIHCITKFNGECYSTCR